MTADDTATVEPLRILTLTATCHDPGCPNEEIVIQLKWDAAHPPQNVQCAPCSNILWDVQGLPAAAQQPSE